MALDSLVGVRFGPKRRTLSTDKVDEFIAATGDDADRWQTSAPPSYAAALLFAVAPDFLAVPAVAAESAVLIHADQAFTWHGPLTRGRPLEVTGSVSRVRARGGLSFVTFDVAALDGDRSVLDSRSTFLLGAAPAGDPPPERAEPAVGARAGVGVGERSASRLDLVRYAAASGDFNPIHFDHEAARAAGLAGVVVHGLLMTAWMLQPVAADIAGDAPLAGAKLRYRDALGAAEPAAVHLEHDDDTIHVTLAHATGGHALVTARVTPRGA